MAQVQLMNITLNLELIKKSSNTSITNPRTLEIKSKIYTNIIAFSEFTYV